MLIPAALVIAGLPYIKSEMSEIEFSNFIIVFALISTLSMLDAGLGRSTTYFVTKALITNSKEAPSYLTASLIIGLFFSLIAVVTITTSILTYSHIQKDNSLNYIVNHIWLLPIIISSILAKGYIEAKQKFYYVGIIQLILGASIIVTPFLSKKIIGSTELFPYLIAIIRIAITLPLILYLYRNNNLFIKIKIKIHEIINYSKWLIVSSLIGIIIIFLDRLLVSNNFSHQEVTDYFFSMEIILKAQIIITTAVAIAFPIIVNKIEDKRNAPNKKRIYKHIIIFQIFIFLITSIIFLITKYHLLPVILTWKNSFFTDSTSAIIMTGIIGFAFIGSSTIIMMVINSFGKTKEIAISHIGQLLIYTIILLIFIKTNDVKYIAFAWLIRLFIDWISMNLILLAIIREKQELPND